MTNLKLQKKVLKHLGVDYEWGEDEHGPYVKASMKEYKEDIWKMYEEKTGRELKKWGTPAYPNTTLTETTQEKAERPEDY